MRCANSVLTFTLQFEPKIQRKISGNFCPWSISAAPCFKIMFTLLALWCLLQNLRRREVCGFIMRTSARMADLSTGKSGLSLELKSAVFLSTQPKKEVGHVWVEPGRWWNARRNKKEGQDVPVPERIKGTGTFVVLLAFLIWNKLRANGK